MSEEKIAAKTWECPECKSCFVKYISLYTHQRQKHRPPCVDCAHCEEKFVSYAARNSHYYRALNGTERKKPKRQRVDTTATDTAIDTAIDIATDTTHSE